MNLEVSLKILTLSLLSVVLQSAAMEETVIWEQHTVTLHRVSVDNSLFPPLSSSVSVRPGIPTYSMSFSILHFFLPVPLCLYISLLAVLKRPAVAAGCVLLKQ